MKTNKFTSRKSEFSTIGESLTDMLKALRIEKKFDEMSIVSNWEELMGPTIASRTEKVYFREQVLFVQLNSAPLKHQLTMSKTKIMEMLNQKADKILVKDITFL